MKLVEDAEPELGKRGPYKIAGEHLAMPYYNLKIVADHRMLATIAADRESAVAEFGGQLDKRLSLNPDNDSPAPYLMDEWTESPHWVNPTIPVFEISN